MTRFSVSYNQEQAIMDRKLKISNQIMGFIYDTHDQLIENQLIDLARQNQVLLNAESPTFMFQGDWYPETTCFGKLNPIPLNKTLHPDLYMQVYNLLCPDKIESDLVRISIKHLINDGLNIVQSTTDIKNLFPEQVSHFIMTECHLPDTSPVAPSLSSELIYRFKGMHAKGFTHINELFITKLLLSTS